MAGIGSRRRTFLLVVEAQTWLEDAATAIRGNRGTGEIDAMLVEARDRVSQAMARLAQDEQEAVENMLRTVDNRVGTVENLGTDL